jgi:hypothetical protein
MAVRLAEQYLIRAEARAQLGDVAWAKEDLNKIRARAGAAANPWLPHNRSYLMRLCMNGNWSCLQNGGTAGLT